MTLKVQLLIHGRSVCQILSVVTRKTTSGTWTRRDCFGEHCQTKVLVKNPNNVKEGKKETTAKHFIFVNATGKEEKPIVIWKS